MPPKLNRYGFTPPDAQGLYAKLGWETVAPEIDHGVPVALMRRRLN